MQSPRGIFVNLIKSQRKQSIEKVREAYLGTGKKNNFKVSRRPDRSYDNRRLAKTQRQKTLNRSQSINRHSISSKKQKNGHKSSREKAKRDMPAWNRTCASLSKQNYEDQRKKNRQGQNCRIVIMYNGKTQKQHFIQVNFTKDIYSFLKLQYPKVNNFLTVPRQLSLQYILTQQSISGQFLNGQSIYLKPQVNQMYQNPEYKSIKMQDFEIFKQIGSGGFSKVFLCRSKIDNNFYAMKLIDKDMIIKNKKKKIIMNERNIMKSTKYPFVIDLKYAFQAQKYIVFIVQYCAGGELFSLIKKYHRLSQQIVRFYIIEIFLGLSHLHSQKVVYRDIKPENILLGIDGHVKIADLGLAKPDMFEGELAYSFCGSPQYMSPEMIMQAGHTYPVDFYCMGALMYELLTGLPPFYSQDPNQIYEAVLVQELTFPEDVSMTSECKSLLRALLCKDPKKRLGSLYGTKQILAHPWFGKRNYQNYIEKKVQPPFHFKNLQKINLDGQIDTKNRQILDKVIKDQKYEKKQFKCIMKEFYYDFQEKKRPLSSSRGNSSKKIIGKQNIKQVMKQNMYSLRKMKKHSLGTLALQSNGGTFNR